MSELRPLRPLRPLVAELTAIDAVMPHGEQEPWPAAVAERRQTLLVALWRGARAAGWHVGYEWDTTDRRRPLVLVVALVDGPLVRGHVTADAVPAAELTGVPVIPWDGARRSYRERVEWLVQHAP